MKRRGSTGRERDVLQRTLLRDGDVVAEALIAHVGCCQLRTLALCLLGIAGLSEMEFLRRWAAGEGSDKA